MEHTLLTPRTMTLQRDGIPYSLIAPLVQEGRYYTANLTKGFDRDHDLDEICRMEKNLGSLSPRQISARVATDCCCIWRYDYPKRVHEICAIIGGSSHTALRLHYQISTERRQELIDYACALKGWLEDRHPDDSSFFRPGSEATTKKVFGFLGSPDHLKKLLVERTYIGLSRRALNCSFWGHNDNEPQTPLQPYHAQELPSDWQDQLSNLERAVYHEMGSGAGNFLCEVGGTAEPACHFKFIRRVDILVSSIGCLEWRGNLPPKDGRIKGRRHITAQYLEILKNFWDGTTASLDADGEKIMQDLFTLMGEPTDFKKWLAACLWKNIENQTMHDAYPMKRWVEFVRIGEEYLHDLNSKS
ncbi:MAG: hypothetical protein GY868_15770 [Deltaproteobacteria bacterium]|nr:hypothetical protein [Deltaproteobacteria bacterium]